MTRRNFRVLRKESERYIAEGKKVKFVVYPQNRKVRYRLEEFK